MSKTKEDSLINWSYLSGFLTNSKETIRQTRIPKIHKKRIDELLYYIECWKKDKKLISPDDFKEKIKNLDLITIILDEK